MYHVIYSLEYILRHFYASLIQETLDNDNDLSASFQLEKKLINFFLKLF